MKNKTIPSIRITEHDYELMQSALKKHNNNSLIKLSFQEFRRTAYLILSKWIVQEKDLSELPIKF